MVGETARVGQKETEENNHKRTKRQSKCLKMVASEVRLKKV